MRLRLWSGIASAMFLTPALAFSQQNETSLKDMSLEELMNVKIYSASRRSESLKDAPQVVTVITPDQLKLFGLRTIHEALTLVPGFDIQKQLRKEFHWTRGLRESALILIDGTSILNTADNEAYLDEAFQIENIKQVEVVRGPGGVLWGTNAFMGVVNVITKDPTKSPFVKANVSGASYDSKRAGFEASTSVGELGLYASGKHLDMKKHPVKIQAQDKAGRNETSYFTDLFFKAKWQEWTLSIRQEKQKEYVPLADVAGGTNAGAYTDTTFFESDPTNIYQLNYDKEFSESLTFHGKASLVERNVDLQGSEDPVGSSAAAFYYDNNRTDKYLVDFNLDHRFNEETQFIWGLSYERDSTYHNWVTDTNGFSPRGTADAKIHIFSGYGQWTQKVSSNITAGAGLRGEIIDQMYRGNSDASFNYRKSDPQTLFNLNAVYKFDGGDHIKLLAAKGLRRPDVEQSTSTVGSFNGSDVTDEVAYSYEAEYYWSINKNMGWSNNYSYNDIYGLIDFVKSAPNTYTATNLSHTVIHSWESEFRANLDSGSYGFVNFAYKDGKRADGLPVAGIDNTNKFNANAAFAYKIQSDLFWSNVVRYVGKKKDTYQLDNGSAPVATPDEREIEDWWTLDTGVIWDNAGVQGLGVRFFVYNALDKIYYMQNRASKSGYLHTQPGRNFDLQVSYEF